jgi:acyl-CoA reductase-like NAD-dependent aldehyde dehydrogenase
MTAPLLESYAAGRWYAAPDEGTPLADAVTGETVARISSTGLDVPAMLEHARTVGGPALRGLTFHQRAGLLKQLALRLMADKDEFYALSRRTGATDLDSAFDIDGGFGTLLSYASKGRRELPTTPSSSTARSSRSASRVPSSASTSTRRCAASPCRSTPSTSRFGGSSRSSPPPSSQACRRS